MCIGNSCALPVEVTERSHLACKRLDLANKVFNLAHNSFDLAITSSDLAPNNISHHLDALFT